MEKHNIQTTPFNHTDKPHNDSTQKEGGRKKNQADQILTGIVNGKDGKQPDNS